MAKRKIPDEMLTPEQLRRRLRNERYKQKKTTHPQAHLQLVEEDTVHKEAPVLKTSLLINKTEENLPFPKRDASKTKLDTRFEKEEDEIDLSAWKEFELIIVKPSLFFSLAFIIGVTSLLVFFQASTYLGEGMSAYLAWGIAIACELSLWYLTILFSVKRNRFLIGVLFLSFFSYVLGTMAYGIKKNEVIEVSRIEENDVNSTLLKESVRKTQEALDLAISRKESGNVARNMKVLSDLTKRLEKPTVENEAQTGIVEVRSIGLIFLRALLMLINAIGIHFTIGLIRHLRENSI